MRVRRILVSSSTLEGGSESISGRVLEAMIERVSDLCLVMECKELEDLFGVMSAQKFDRGGEVGKEKEGESEGSAMSNFGVRDFLISL